MKKIGKEGNSDTQFLIWLLYVNNLYISKPKAYVWIKKAAFNKHPRATFAMGLLYYYGYIVPEQKSKAIKLFKESAALGYSFTSIFLNKQFTLFLRKFFGGSFKSSINKVILFADKFLETSSPIPPQAPVTIAVWPLKFSCMVIVLF